MKCIFTYAAYKHIFFKVIDYLSIVLYNVNIISNTNYDMICNVEVWEVLASFRRYAEISFNIV